MILWKRAAPLGVMSWLIPFVISFILFPLKQWNAPLFGALMGLVVLLAGAVLLHRYFRNRSVSVNEAVLVGMMWLVLNLSFDYPKMTAWSYYSEIGLSYLMLPAFAFGAARLTRP